MCWLKSISATRKNPGPITTAEPAFGGKGSPHVVGVIGIVLYRWDMTSNEATIHDEIAQGLKEHPARKGMLFNVLVTAIEIGGSIGLFHLAKGLGASDVVSYLVGSIGPVVGGLADLDQGAQVQRRLGSDLRIYRAYRRSSPSSAARIPRCCSTRIAPPPP